MKAKYWHQWCLGKSYYILEAPRGCYPPLLIRIALSNPYHHSYPQNPTLSTSLYLTSTWITSCGLPSFISSVPTARRNQGSWVTCSNRSFVCVLVVGASFPLHLDGIPKLSLSSNVPVWVPNTPSISRVLVMVCQILYFGSTLFVLLGGSIFRFSQAPCVSYLGRHTKKSSLVHLVLTESLDECFFSLSYIFSLYIYLSLYLYLSLLKIFNSLTPRLFDTLSTFLLMTMF